MIGYILYTNFNPRSPCGERQYRHEHHVHKTSISIHAPRVGSDSNCQICNCIVINFNPRSPCGERPERRTAGIQAGHISIHAPRVGSDVIAGLVVGLCHISIHAPRVGSDGRSDIYWHWLDSFQSTLPVWGATEGRRVPLEQQQISIHAPRVGSDKIQPGYQRGREDFNPRSPCGERPPFAHASPRFEIFQSTLPVWGATKTGTDLRGGK